VAIMFVANQDIYTGDVIGMRNILQAQLDSAALEETLALGFRK
jgi:hypothetical protein